MRKYVEKYDEILRTIHLLVCIKMGIKRENKIGKRRMVKHICAKEVKIGVDEHINLDRKIKEDKPDILIIIKTKRMHYNRDRSN